MPESPEVVRDTYTPEELVRRLEEIRRLHKGGALSAKTFNDFVSAFRFNDAAGHLWSIGANTGQWYRWDMTAWTPATPPQSLMLENASIQQSSEWIITAGAGTRPSLQCSQCKASAADGTFCTKCGGKLVPAATPASPAHGVSSCSGCGTALKPGTKFCMNCGLPVTAQAPACRRCGKTIAAGVKFCTGCGAPVAA